MRKRIVGIGLWLGLWFAVSSLADISVAAEKSAHDLLPPTTVGYLEVPQPGRAIDAVLSHALAHEILQLPVYQKALAGREYQQLQRTLKLVEDKLGMSWRDALGRLTSGGVYVGFDLPTQGFVALAQATDELSAQKARETVLAIVRAEAASRNRPDPVQEDELRGIATHQIGKVYLAVLGKWLLASNKPLLVSMVIENYLGSGVSLASNEQFKAVRQARQSSPSAWLYVDLRVLRLTGALRSALNKKSNNPLAELVAGGVLGALPDAPYATAALELDTSHVRLSAAFPGNPRTVPKAREFYFGPDGAGAAPPLLHPPGTLLTLAAYRDFASLWRHAPDLFDERINAKFAEAESNLATFFGGRNFRDEILGNLEPGVQVVVARQEFPQAGVSPAIKLPGAALVVRMKQPAQTARTFKITFQSVIGFLNIVGGMKGLPPLDLNSEKMGDALVIAAEYLPPDKAASRLEAPIHHNASPTAVILGDRFILSSARPLAMAVLHELQEQSPMAASVNSVLLIEGATAHSSLLDNRAPLVAKNMLDRGHDRTAAETEIDSVLRALTHVERSAARLTANGKLVEFSLDVNFAPAAP